jgi:hypothetical protein
LDEAAAEPALPFFIEWAPQTKLPGQTAIRHSVGTARIARLVVSADPRRLADWLGSHQLPIAVNKGRGGLTTIYISSDAGEISLGSAP